MERYNEAGWRVVDRVAGSNVGGLSRYYAISQHRNGQYGCECLAYRNAKGEKTCKHIQKHLGFLPAPAKKRIPERRGAIYQYDEEVGF